MEAVQAGRIWLNLREANATCPEYAALCDEISGGKGTATRSSRLLKRDLGLLISSPGAMVFYHLDVPLTSLWHIRGDKSVSGSIRALNPSSSRPGHRAVHSPRRPRDSSPSGLNRTPTPMSSI